MSLYLCLYLLHYFALCRYFLHSIQLYISLYFTQYVSLSLNVFSYRYLRPVCFCIVRPVTQSMSVSFPSHSTIMHPPLIHLPCLCIFIYIVLSFINPASVSFSRSLNIYMFLYLLHLIYDRIAIAVQFISVSFSHLYRHPIRSIRLFYHPFLT